MTKTPRWCSTPTSNTKTNFKTNFRGKWVSIGLLCTTTWALLLSSSPCNSFQQQHTTLTPMNHHHDAMSMRFQPSAHPIGTVPSPRLPSYRIDHSSSSSSRMRSSALSLRRRLLSEDDLADPPDKNVLDAVEGMGGSNLLASDVAAKAGVSLSTARKSLSALASLTRGDIAVTSSGDLLYTFPSPSVKAALASNNLRYRLQSTWTTQVWPKLFWGIRVGFGLSIFVSLAAIFTTFLFVSAGGGSSSDDDRDDGRRRGGGDGGFGARLMFDLFYPRPLYFSYGPNYGYYGRYDPYMTPLQRRQQYEDDDLEEEPNFFEKIFSYIFGDGNPNRGLEAARLRLAAEMIRENGGAVVAEQLAPFCDVENPDESKDDDDGMVDEGFVLPIVTQLGGEPTVTDDGDIVYVFRDLQVSAGADEDDAQIRESLSRRIRDRLSRQRTQITQYDDDDDDDYPPTDLLQEQKAEFSRTGTLGKLLAGGLGVVNLVGAIYLGLTLSSPAMAGVQLPGMYGLVQSGYPLLLAYAILYNAIPAGRFVYLQKVNDDVDKRNSARRRWLTRVKEARGKVGRKLGAARSMRQKMRRLGTGKVDMVYDTTDDFMDVEKKKEMDSLKEFDELLKDDNMGSFE